ncbi:hypothetical protein [Hyphomicrobium sp. 2TAF46]|uniref:hypothetical protein n=1 Tax=Hyphomicrobium sp. 2TAF46 TaxID=3233019 RepID=UPI003F90F4EF
MMIRAATTDPFSLSDAAALVGGLLIVGVLVFCVSICAEDSPISDFLHRTQAEADASRFNALLSALNGPQRNSKPISERAASHERVPVADGSFSPGRRREEIRLSDKD